MPRLARLRFVSIGHPNARFDDLTLDFRDASGRATDTTLWLRNGGGKSSVLNLFFALVRPDRRDFLGGKAEARRRSLDDYILADDRAVIACEWGLDQASGRLGFEEEPGALLTGVFYEWRSGAASDDTRLRRLFFGCRPSEADSRASLAGLPLFVTSENGRRGRRTLASFRQEWMALREGFPHLQVFVTESQREWADFLDAAGIDPELFVYQIKMNQREGAVDELFRFEEHEDFVDFLLELALDPVLGERVGRNLATFRRELSERKNRILPERELLEGLGSRLGPIIEIAADRSVLLAGVARAGRELSSLVAHIEDRVASLGREETAQAEMRDQQRDEAEQAKTRSADRWRRAAAVRRFAAERRLAKAREDLERTKRQMEDAQRQMQIWEAAVPLYSALRFEREAQGYQQDLDRKRQEAAPLLSDLQNAALALAAGLRYRITTLRRRQDERLAAERDAREEARGCRKFAAEAQSKAARANDMIQRLEELLEEARREREQLEGRSILDRAETGAVASARLASEISELEARSAALDDRIAGLRQRLRNLNSEKEEATVAIARLQTYEDQERRFLEQAEAVRRGLEENAVLRKHLELEAVDIEKLSEQALAQLYEAARKALEQFVRLEIERAEDDRAVLYLEQAGLLPPTTDAGKVLEFLKSRLASVWSGWSYIEANTPKDASVRRSVIERHPHLAMGVIVRDADLAKAKDLLDKSELIPETPVTVAPASAVGATADPAGLVIGPASDAYFDRTAAQTELLRRRARLDSNKTRLEQEDARRRETDEILARLRDFRERYPKGWFGEQQSKINAYRASREAQAQRAAALAAEVERVEFEIGQLERERQHAVHDLSEKRIALALLDEFVRRYEIPASERQTALERERGVCAEAKQDQGRWEEEGHAAEQRAEENSGTARKLGEDASATEEELRTVSYIPGAYEGATGALDDLRDRYRRLKTQYEENVGEEGLLQLRRAADQRAQEERRKFTAIESEGGVDEETVRAVLQAMEEPALVNARRQEAIKAYSSSRGTHGYQTQVEQSAQEELKRAQKNCDELGGISELAPAEQPAGPIQAEDEAKVAEEEARGLQGLAEHHHHLSEQAEATRLACAHRIETLRNHREHLETISQSYQELLVSAATGYGEVEPFVPPAADEVIAQQSRKIQEALDQAKSRSTKLDEERRKAVRAVRSWANEPRFEELKNQVARQFATTDEPDLEAQAANWRKELELRVQVINDQLTEMNQHREILVTETLGAASEALALLRSASAQSRLPDHFPRLGGAQFLRITTHEPESPAEQRGRIGELIDELVDQGDIPLGIKLVQQAVRRLAKPIRVKVLNPDPDLEQDAVDITDMARFSGGEQLTSAILLYCSLAQLRARNRGISRKPSSVLILDNPIGRASRVRFLELQRDVARAMGVQLLYTTAVNDHDALRTLPNVIRLRNQRIDRNTGNRVVEFDAEDAGSIEAVRVVRSEAPDAG